MQEREHAEHTQHKLEPLDLEKCRIKFHVKKSLYVHVHVHVHVQCMCDISCMWPPVQPIPSPAPPTPLLPASPATSVGSPAHSTITPEENEAYLRTHHELQKYLPLLNRMMNRQLKKEGEDAHKSEQYMKLKSLHSLLQDDKKRWVRALFV